jgi:hypothetical protein
MSIIVSVKINDGIVMAADSTTTFFKETGEAFQSYDHANKIVNLVKGLPIGVMTCGSGGIGNESIETLLKDLRVRLSRDGEQGIDPERYSLEDVSTTVREFFDKQAIAAGFKAFLILRICGYSSGRPLPEVWQIGFSDGQCFEPISVQKETDIGPRWNGEQEALDRLILGMAPIVGQAVVQEGILTKEQAEVAVSKLYKHTVETLIMNAAPIQDAIELARYMVETTKGFVRFSIKRATTVGGAVEIATITKHEGFKWIHRKHFYSRELNRTT